MIIQFKPNTASLRRRYKTPAKVLHIEKYRDNEAHFRFTAWLRSLEDSEILNMIPNGNNLPER